MGEAKRRKQLGNTAPKGASYRGISPSTQAGLIWDSKKWGNMTDEKIRFLLGEWQKNEAVRVEPESNN